MSRWWLAVLAVLWMPMAAGAQPSLLGTYKLVSLETRLDDGTVVELFGKRPNGYIVITPTRFRALIVAEGRRAGLAAEDKVALYNSLISYSGPYWVEGQKLLTSVDVSWNQAWTGTTQARTWSIDGNRLTLTTDKSPFFQDPTKTSYGILVWEKVE